MKMKSWVLAGLAGVLGAGLGAAEVHATPSTATSTVLAQATVAPLHIHAHNLTLDGKRWRAVLKTRGLSDGYVVDNKFAPGQGTGWHAHPGPSLVFVVAGSVTNYESDARHCAGVTYQAGSSFIDAGNAGDADDAHLLRNDGTVPAETIAVQLIPKGLPRRSDVPLPKGCEPS
jgi:hypothetical protein